MQAVMQAPLLRKSVGDIVEKLNLNDKSDFECVVWIELNIGILLSLLWN